MNSIIKLSFIFGVIALGLAMGPSILAQEIEIGEETEVQATAEIELDETVEAEDLEIQEPRLLPDNPFYFLKKFGRGIRSFFTFNPVKKAELKSRFANEKLIEIKALVAKKKDSKLIKKRLDDYKKEMDRVKDAVEKIKETAAENPRVDAFLNKFTKHQLLHHTLLLKLETQVPEDVLVKIKEARERHLEKFGEVMIKLEDKEEKIQERLEEKLEERAGSKFKHFKNLEVLKNLEEKVPEAAKDAIRKAQENSLKRLQENLEKMSSEDQEKFRNYVDRISGDREKHLEIIENLKFELQGKMPILKRSIDATREKVLEGIHEGAPLGECPEFERPAPGFCSNGRTLIKRDDKKCVVGFQCIVPEEAIAVPPSLPREQNQVCIHLWNPVCGENGKTYSNACFAKVAGVAVTHRGVCKESIKPSEPTRPTTDVRIRDGIKEIELTVSAPFSEAALRIYRDGAIRYEASAPDAGIEKQTDSGYISKEALSDLTDIIGKNNFYSLLDSYYPRLPVSDASIYSITVVSDDRSKTVTCSFECPEKFWNIMSAIEKVWGKEILEVGV